ncbi:cystathionine gamma-synthase [Gonapodya prolifera JEL478]|uniref:Cystathionine gamma-synthase n=1 Tax=Gonapodya prolifera (strain JEL478) TaxID=1344416 RepID=A0A138ZZ89_GONPJ|nr:cystathionine gamma-synthase [Gonapodya prolifera JEL478]|eukprot:KXS09826.1 cystathionine gamma-synthase [Gonapodya prolifera JEL478]
MTHAHRSPLSFASIAVHADDYLAELDPTGPVAPAISVSTTFRHPPSYNDWPRNPDHVPSDPHEPVQHIYSRDSSPIIERVEVVVAALESAYPSDSPGGSANTLPPKAYAVSYGSGLNAVHAMLVFYQPKRIIKSRAGYFGSEAAARTYQRGRDVEILYLDTIETASGIYRKYESRPRDLVLLESPMNPTNDVEDLEWWTSRRVPGAFVAIDGTFAPPPLQFPLRHGIDIVMHSTTKYMGGHSDLMGGVLVVTDPKAALGLREDRTNNGWQPGSLESSLLLRSLRSLPLRVTRQSATATKLAAWLSGADARAGDEEALSVVDKVLHTSVPGTKGHEVASKYLVGGHAACFAVVFKNAHYARLAVLKMRLFANATSLGGVESLAEWRHAVDPNTIPELVRLSVGLEEFEDLQEDLRSAFVEVKAETDKVV